MHHSSMALPTLEQCVYLTRMDEQTQSTTVQPTKPFLANSSDHREPTPSSCKSASGAKPRSFPCTVTGCDKSFRRRSTLNEHVTTHTGTKAFACPVNTCKRSFSTSGNLSRHKRLQHPWLDKPLDCLVDDCGCSFASEAKLERHMQMVHFDASPHSCRVKHCGRAFCSAGNLRRHMKQRHSLLLEPATPRSKAGARTLSPTAVDHFTIVRAETRWSNWTPHAAEKALFDDEDAELLDALACLFD